MKIIKCQIYFKTDPGGLRILTWPLLDFSSKFTKQSWNPAITMFGVFPMVPLATIVYWTMHAFRVLPMTPVVPMIPLVKRNDVKDNLGLKNKLCDSGFPADPLTLVPTQKFLRLIKPEAHGPQRSPECTAMKAIFSQNTVNVACKKN